MEAVPRMPMLSLELKHSPEPVEFTTTLKQYIRDHYHEDPANYNKACLELEQLRQNSVHVTHDFIGCSTLKKYYAQLQYLQSRFPLQDGGEPPLIFTWEDVQSGREYSHSDLKFEQACILYNIGALHSLLGAMDTRQSAEGMKVSCTHFQCAAWAFQYLRDHIGSSAMSPDMAHEILSFQIDLMLAQAQECILEKSMTDNRKSSITAKVAVQIAEFYRQALRNLETTNSEGLISSRRYKDWKRRMEIKILFYQTIMFFYLGCQSEEQQKHGERLAYFTASTDKLTQASKLAKNDISEIHESLRFTQDVVGGKFNSAKKDNDFVYHEKVPAIDSLPEIKGASLVKGIPFNPNDVEVSGPDIFQKLVPMEAHESSSLYSEEKAKLLREVGAEVEAKDGELVQFMSSLQLDEGKLRPEPERLPQSLLEKCAAISVRPNAVKDLVGVMGAVSGMATEVELGLQELSEGLEEEDRAEEEHQKLFGPRSRTIILPELRKECEICSEQHCHGSQSNAELHKAMNTHTVNLKLISGPLDVLQKALPTTELTKSSDNEAIVSEVQRILNKVDEMKKQRLNLHDQFREEVHKDDITNAIVTHEGTDTKTFFQAQLQKHDQLVGFLRQNLTAQDNILKALTEANAKFANIRKFTTESSAMREAKISELINSYDVYEDLMGKSKKGLEFYTKLESTVMRLLQRAKSIIKTNNEEREQLRKRFTPKEEPPSRPAAQKPTSFTNLPTSSQSALPSFDGPKLKDYLPSMKPATFGPNARGVAKPPSDLPGHYPSLPQDVPDVIVPTNLNQTDHSKIQAYGSENLQSTLPFNPQLSQGPDGSNLPALPPGYSYVEDVPPQPLPHPSYQPARQPQTNPRVRQKFESTNTVSSVDTPIISPTKDSMNGHMHNIYQPVGLRPQDFTDGQIPFGQPHVNHNQQDFGPTPRFPPHPSYSHRFQAPGQPRFPVPTSAYSAVHSQSNQPGVSMTTMPGQRLNQPGVSMPGQQPLQRPAGNAQSNTALYQGSYGGVQLPQGTPVNQVPAGATVPLNYQPNPQYGSTVPGHPSSMPSYQGQIPVGLNQPPGAQNPYQQGPSYQSYGSQQIPTASSLPSNKPILSSQPQTTGHQTGNQYTVSGQSVQQGQTSMQQGQHYPNTSSPSQQPIYRPQTQISSNQPQPQGHTGTPHWQQQQQSQLVPNSGQPTAFGHQQPPPGQYQPNQNQQFQPQSSIPTPYPVPNAPTSMVNQGPNLPTSMVNQGPNLPTSVPNQPVPATSQPTNMYSKQTHFSQAQQPSFPNQQTWTAHNNSAVSGQNNPGVGGQNNPVVTRQNNPAVSGWYGQGAPTSTSQMPQQLNQTHSQYQAYAGQTVPGGQTQQPSRTSLPSTSQPFNSSGQTVQQHPQQPFQHIQPPQVPMGQPQQHIQPPQVPMGQPQQHIQPPQVPMGQPQQHIQPPQVSMGQPQQHIQPPQVSMGQPQQHIQPPQVSMGQPQSMRSQQPGMIGQPQYVASQTQHGPPGQMQYSTGPAQQGTIGQAPYSTNQTQQGLGHPQHNQIRHPEQTFTQQTPTIQPQGPGQPQHYAAGQHQHGPGTQTILHPPQQMVQMQQGFPGHPPQGSVGQPAQSSITQQGFTRQQQQVPMTFNQQHPMGLPQPNPNVIQQHNIIGQSQQGSAGQSQPQIGQNVIGQTSQTNMGQQYLAGVRPGSQTILQPTIQPPVIQPTDVSSRHPMSTPSLAPGGTTPVIAPGLVSGGKVTETGANRPDQTASPVKPHTTPSVPHNVLSRQSSTTSSFDDILSSSPENFRDIPASDPVLTPKVLTAQELQQQKEEAMKLHDNQQPKDPFTVKETLDRFVGDVERFEKVVENLCKPKLSGPSHLLAEWKEMSVEQEKIAHKQSIAVARCYIFKNRDPDIMPYDETRVLLKSGKDDYINASWMDDLAPSCPKFIASQGPLPVTLVDFWVMVYEQGTEVIVMLSREDEPGKKTPVYWPKEKGQMIQHGPISLTLQSVKNKEFWVERIIYLTHSETKQGRTIVHLQYMNWPVSGLPEKIPYILQFINEVQYFYKQQRSLLKPVIVHCSNGVGRTGTFLTIYTGIQEVNKGHGIIDLPTIVTKMRSKRKHMITDMEHLKFCYQAILYHSQDELMKRGILTNKKSFSDKIPSPGEKSHSRKPSEDLIFNAAMGLHNLESNVAKLTSKHHHGDKGDKPGPKDKPVSQEDLSSVPGQTEITSLQQTLPDLILQQQHDKFPLSDNQSKVDMLCGLDTSRETVSAPRDVSGSVSAPRDASGSVSGTQSLGGSPQHRSDNLGEQRSSLPPSLADLQNPQTFTLDANTGGRKRITKASFTQKKSQIVESTGDAADPLSNLDPLWTLHKTNSSPVSSSTRLS